MAAKKKARTMNQKELDEDPLLQLGFGIVAYRDMLYNMIFVFSIFSLLMTPAFYYYSKGGAYPSIVKNEGYTLGNYGYSST